MRHAASGRPQARQARWFALEKTDVRCPGAVPIWSIVFFVLSLFARIKLE